MREARRPWPCVALDIYRVPSRVDGIGGPATGGRCAWAPVAFSVAEATATLSAAVAASGTTLTDLHGIGEVVAAKILAGADAVSKFRSEAAFASYCGVAPIEESSGDIQRHRLSRAGDRQMNYALHVMAQIERATPGRDLLPLETSRGQDAQRRHALSQTAPGRSLLPDHDPRYGDVSAADAWQREVPFAIQTPGHP